MQNQSGFHCIEIVQNAFYIDNFIVGERRPVNHFDKYDSILATLFDINKQALSLFLRRPRFGFFLSKMVRLLSVVVISSGVDQIKTVKNRLISNTKFISI